MARFSLDVDGKVHSVAADPATPLLYILRNELGLRNPRFGCGLAQCGACTVHVDGVPTRSCAMPVEAIGASRIATLAGLSGPNQKMHRIQQAFIEEEAPQCGYCLNGWLMTAAALLESNPTPTDADIREALAEVKCRCGAHLGIIRAVKNAAGSSQGESA